MNLVQEYIMRNKGLIILISGLSGSNRTILAKEIGRDFEIKLLTLENYCKEENVKMFEVNSEIKIHDWEHIDIYDWKKFNKDIENEQKTGVVVYGDYFPTFKLEFKPNFHIHVKISKEKLIENRKEYIEKNPEKCAELLEFIKNNNFELIINKITYPYYLEYREKSHIDKFVNSDKNTSDEIYDQVFEYIKFSMIKFLNEYYAENPQQPTKLTPQPPAENTPVSNTDAENSSLSDTDTTSLTDTDSDANTFDLNDDESIELGTLSDPVGEAHFL